MNWFTRIPPRRLRAVLASAIGLSALALVSIGYRAVAEWQHAASNNRPEGQYPISAIAFRVTFSVIRDEQ